MRSPTKPEQHEVLLTHWQNSLAAVQKWAPIGGCYGEYDGHGRIPRGLYRITRVIKIAEHECDVYGVLVFASDLADCDMLRVAQIINAESACAHSWHSGGKGKVA